MVIHGSETQAGNRVPNLVMLGVTARVLFGQPSYQDQGQGTSPDRSRFEETGERSGVRPCAHGGRHGSSSSDVKFAEEQSGTVGTMGVACAPTVGCRWLLRWKGCHWVLGWRICAGVAHAQQSPDVHMNNFFEVVGRALYVVGALQHERSH